MKTYKEFILESTRRKGERYDSSQGFDYHSDDPNLLITRRRDGRATNLHHTPTGITFRIGHGDPKYSKYTDPDLQNTIHSHKPTHEVSWSHNQNPENLSRAQRVTLARNADRIFRNNIHRFPAGHIISGVPADERRERAYNNRGFGRRGPTKSKQYAAKIGNRLHPIHND